MKVTMNGKKLFEEHSSRKTFIGNDEVRAPAICRGSSDLLKYKSVKAALKQNCNLSGPIA